MGEPDEYEILPHKELIDLKKQIAEMKQSYAAKPAMQESIDALNRSINSLMHLFKTASEEIRLEKHDEETVAGKLGPVMKKLNEIEAQNEKIAEAILAISDMIHEKEAHKPKVETYHNAYSEPIKNLAGMQQPIYPSPIMQKPVFNQQQDMQMDLPPMPPASKPSKRVLDF